MEKIKCPNCGEMVEPETKRDKYGFHECVCPKCGTTSISCIHPRSALAAFRDGQMNENKSFPRSQPDMVNHPNHYINENGVECQTVIDYVLSNIDVTKTAAYWLGCSIKYLFRYKRKGKPIQDLSKARVCFDRAIEYLKKDVENTN